MKVYVTFGFAHIHNVNGKVFNHNCVAEIDADDYFAGREKAFELFGPKFCTTYHKLEDVNMKYYPRGLINVEGDKS